VVTSSLSTKRVHTGEGGKNGGLGLGKQEE
jgi:hypothetical protein